MAAEDEYGKALGAAHAREAELTNLRGARSRLHASQRAVEEEKARLTGERDDINLIGRQADWGESDEAARRHLLALDDVKQRRTTTEWNEEACQAEQTSHAHRASLALGIKSTLRQVASAFDELDQAYGGYGAGLDYPEPEPPAEPDRPWQWTVAPKWRRAEGQRTGNYNLKANTAQIDEKAAKLVCAAALAGGGGRPLVLILDELGRNLGKQHRRGAVALFERIGRDHNITVIGALQDDMERYAIEASGLYIKLRRSSDAIAYDEPPVVAGDEASHGRVELLAKWLASYRPAATTPPAREPA